MHTKSDIEYDYSVVKAKALKMGSGVRTRNMTEALLLYMLENPKKIWWFAWEVVGKETKDGHWLSYKAPARLSDLANFESLLVEERRVGRFMVYRLRTENMSLIKKRLDLK